MSEFEPDIIATGKDLFYSHENPFFVLSPPEEGDSPPLNFPQRDDVQHIVEFSVLAASDAHLLICEPPPIADPLLREVIATDCSSNGNSSSTMDEHTDIYNNSHLFREGHCISYPRITSIRKPRTIPKSNPRSCLKKFGGASKTYEIVIGGCSNKMSCIRRGMNRELCMNIADYNILRAGMASNQWLNLTLELLIGENNNIIRVFVVFQDEERCLLLEGVDSSSRRLRGYSDIKVLVSTGYNHIGYWRSGHTPIHDQNLCVELYASHGRLTTTHNALITHTGDIRSSVHGSNDNTPSKHESRDKDECVTSLEKITTPFSKKEGKSVISISGSMSFSDIVFRESDPNITHAIVTQKGKEIHRESSHLQIKSKFHTPKDDNAINNSLLVNSNYKVSAKRSEKELNTNQTPSIKRSFVQLFSEATSSMANKFTTHTND